MHHYDDALEEARFASLVAPVTQLSERFPYRGKNIADLLEQGAPTNARGGGEILVIAGVGRVPFKVPKRVPIGAAVGIVAADVTGDLDVLERSAFKVLVFPELVPAVGTYHSAATTIDGDAVPMDQVTNLGAELVREYEEIKPKIMAAAITRLISRAVIAEGARAAGNELAGGGGWAGVLASTISEGLLVAADRPDTRSWMLLPEKIFVSRKRVPAGPHEVQVGLGQANDAWQTFAVDVPEDGYVIVVVMPLH